MHILIIPSEHYIPIENPLQGIFQQHQAHALARAGFQVGVISPILRSLRLLKHRWRGWPRGIQAEADQGVAVLRHFGWQIPRLSHLILHQWLQVGELLIKEYIKNNGQPDVVHAHNALLAGVLASEIKKKWGIPYVLTEHSSAYARGFIRPFWLQSAKRAFQNADRRLVVSPTLGQDLERTVGNSVALWEWVPNILSTRFENAREDRSLRPSNQPFLFVSLGSLDENKGQADLLFAFASQFKQKDDVQLRIGGDGPLREELENLSQKLGIDSQVTFLGWLNPDQVIAEMQKCNAFVLSSHYETFGVVLIEALACGKPVIATMCGGPEWIVNSENGILVPPRDITTLGQAMANLQATAHQYNSSRIRQDCIAKFGEQAVVGHLARVYSEVVHPVKVKEIINL
jgi:glycosyltransferase involved in cell wall biosynthesis